MGYHSSFVSGDRRSISHFIFVILFLFACLIGLVDTLWRQHVSTGIPFVSHISLERMPGSVDLGWGTPFSLFAYSLHNLEGFSYYFINGKAFTGAKHQATHLYEPGMYSGYLSSGA